MKLEHKQQKIEIIIDNLEFHNETPALRAAASKIISLPDKKEQQQDLLYFSGIFVSTGENLNGAHFMGSEVIIARDTIKNKAMDIEHKEEEIVGHIYDYAFIDNEGKPIDVIELASMEKASQDKSEMHVVIAGVVYKYRFPNLAQEVSEKKWKLSMECYYEDFDIKIGDMVLTRPEATSLGLACMDDSIIGKVGKVLKDGVEMASGKIARVLRKICFSGCGFVKNPANPPSVILETAGNNTLDHTLNEDDQHIILNYANLKNNNLTSDNIPGKEEIARDGLMDDTVGVCSYYVRMVLNDENEVEKEAWCSLYDKSCTAFGFDATDPNCLMNSDIKDTAVSRVNELIEKKNNSDMRKELLSKLRCELDTASCFKKTTR